MTRKEELMCRDELSSVRDTVYLDPGKEESARESRYRGKKRESNLSVKRGRNCPV